MGPEGVRDGDGRAAIAGGATGVVVQRVDRRVAVGVRSVAWPLAAAVCIVVGMVSG
jgi:hypothetical protein